MNREQSSTSCDRTLKISLDASSPNQLCSVLIPSCDSYSDLWKPFLNLFWRFWPDCPFPVYLGSNEKSSDDSRVKTIHAGGGNNWTNRVREQVQAVSTPYVLLFLEDFFLQSPVNTSDVLTCLTAIQELKGKMLRLIPRPGPDAVVDGHPMLGHCAAGALFRSSTQTAIWQRDALLDLMRDNESIWEFEMLGSNRSNSSPDGYFCTWKPVMTYRHHVVERGKWFRHEARKFLKMNIGCDFSRRSIMTHREMLSWRFSKIHGLVSVPLIRKRALRKFQNQKAA